MRAVVIDSGTISTHDYKPFGEKFVSDDTTSQTKERTGFIGKERDHESELSNFGVRAYSELTGRFTMVDPMWESYYSLSPYNYSNNNPLIWKDPNGKKYTFADNIPLENRLQINLALYDMQKSKIGRYTYNTNEGSNRQIRFSLAGLVGAAGSTSSPDNSHILKDGTLWYVDIKIDSETFKSQDKLTEVVVDESGHANGLSLKSGHKIDEIIKR